MAIIMVLGVLLYMSLEIEVNLIWTSFLILPFTVSTFLTFFGIWVSNDFFVFERVMPKREEGEGRSSIQEEDRNVVKVRERELPFCTKLQQLLTCEYKPRTTKDKFSFCKTSSLSLAGCIFINIASIILYSIATIGLFDPWWVGYTIGSGIAMT